MSSFEVTYAQRLAFRERMQKAKTAREKALFSIDEAKVYHEHRGPVEEEDAREALESGADTEGYVADDSSSGHSSVCDPPSRPRRPDFLARVVKCRKQSREDVCPYTAENPCCGKKTACCVYFAHAWETWRENHSLKVVRQSTNCASSTDNTKWRVSSLMASNTATNSCSSGPDGPRRGCTHGG